MLRSSHRSRTAAVATLGLALLTPFALAQTPPSTPPQQAPATAPANPADTGPAPTQAELANFAKAAVAVQGIRNAMQPKLASAQGTSAKTQIKQAAEKQMEAAVESNNLSLHRYIQIADVVQQNSTIRAEVQKLMPPAPAASKS